MKIFAIRDETDQQHKNLAYLVYYEKAKQFYIELPENADPWETPLLLSSLAKRGEKTVNSYWSGLWVRLRIIPSDRQNLGQILRDNGMETYDEYELLMLSKGRCAQDDYYLEPLEETDLPDQIWQRYRYKVEDVVPVSERKLMVFFRDGLIKRCDVTEIRKNQPELEPVLRDERIFNRAAVQAGGYGVCWGEQICISDEVLYSSGERIPLSIEDLKNLVAFRVVNANEAAEMLDCTRQNINDLVRRGRLHPLKSEPKNTLFWKSEIEKRLW